MYEWKEEFLSILSFVIEIVLFDKHFFLLRKILRFFAYARLLFLILSPILTCLNTIE
jgi:hypothetical protein